MQNTGPTAVLLGGTLRTGEPLARVQALYGLSRCVPVTVSADDGLTISCPEGRGDCVVVSIWAQRSTDLDYDLLILSSRLVDMC